MGLFNGMLKEDESLFINEFALDFDYLPHIIKFREEQQKYLATCIKPLFSGRMGKNILITGAPGIGKTAACRFVLREMQKETDSILPIYINCWKKDTPHKIVLEICDQIGYKWTHNKKTDELMKNIAEILNKKAAVIILDEIDKIDADQVLYQLLEDLYKKSIFLITNDKDWLVQLDQRVKSRLLPEILEFKPYNYDEILGILQQRVEMAFVPTVWTNEALEKVADKAFELEDVRTGLFLLREAGTAAENKSLKQIKPEHSDLAISKLNDFKPINSKDLDKECKEVLKMIKANKSKTSTEMYELYKKDFDKSYRTFHRKLKMLEEANLIIITEEMSAQGGKYSVLETKEK
ncbi:MAG: AAA family ATPase [archaeon]